MALLFYVYIIAYFQKKYYFLVYGALYRHLLYYAVCGGVNWAKGRARHIPPQTDTVVRFAPEHVVLFLGLS